MKKFITKLIIFLLPLIVGGISMELLLRRIPNDYAYKSEYLKKNGQSIETIFMGNSHGYYGINPSLMDSSFNASHIAQSLDIDHAILKKNNPYLDNLKTLFIPLDYHSLYTRLEDSPESWRIKNYKIFYQLKVPSSFKNNFELLSHNLKRNLKRLGSYYIKKNKPMTSSVLGYGADSRKQVNLQKSAISAAKRHTNTSTKWVKPNILKINQIIDIVGEDVQIVLYSTPVHGSYLSQANPLQLNYTLKVADSIANQHQNVYNFNSIALFANRDEFFRDADHLNKTGATTYTEKVIDFIHSIEKHQ